MSRVAGSAPNDRSSSTRRWRRRAPRSAAPASGAAPARANSKRPSTIPRTRESWRARGRAPRGTGWDGARSRRAPAHGGERAEHVVGDARGELLQLLRLALHEGVVLLLNALDLSHHAHRREAATPASNAQTVASCQASGSRVPAPFDALGGALGYADVVGDDPAPPGCLHRRAAATRRSDFAARAR